MNQKVKDNNSSNSSVFGRWPQTKMVNNLGVCPRGYSVMVILLAWCASNPGTIPALSKWFLWHYINLSTTQSRSDNSSPDIWPPDNSYHKVGNWPNLTQPYLIGLSGAMFSMSQLWNGFLIVFIEGLQPFRCNVVRCRFLSQSTRSDLPWLGFLRATLQFWSRKIISLRYFGLRLVFCTDLDNLNYFVLRL